MRCYSQREFAKKAGVSPQRLSELISQGFVHVTDGGSVPEDEIEFFIREKMKKSIVSANKSHLCVCIDKSDEELKALREAYANGLKERNSSLSEVSSVSEIVQELKVNVFSEEVTDDKVRGIEVKYRKALLKELLKKTQSAVFRLINKFADTKTVGMIPTVSLYEMLMYNHLYTETDAEKEDEYYKLLTTPISDNESTTLNMGSVVPLKMMETTYQLILASLNLIGEDKKVMFSRSDFSPEVIREIEAMSDDVSAPKAEALKEFFLKPVNINVKATNRKDGSEALKILQSISDKTRNMERNSKMNAICSNGFYTFYNVKEGTDNADVVELASDISDGYYKNITILATQDIASKRLPMYLQSAIDTSIRNRTATVKFDLN